MKEFLTVMSYTFKENMRKKVFFISTIVTLILVVIVLNIPTAIKFFQNNDNENLKDQSKKIGTIYVIDSKGILKEGVSKLQKVFIQYDIKAATENKINLVKQLIKGNSDITLINLKEKNGLPYFDYWVKQNGNGPSPDSISSAIKSIYVANILKAAKVSDNITYKVQANIENKVNELGKGMMKSFISCIIIIMLMYFLVYFYGYGVSMSVASEKTSRVMELLITSTKPSRIILGKSAAMGLLGLCQFIMILAIATLTYKISFPKDFTFAGQPIDFASFTPFVLLMVIIYFILGYSFYSMLNAVAGASVSKAEDVNSALMPISLITLVAFYFAYATIGLPNGTIAVVSSMIPFSAPFSMPCRLLMTEVPLWQIITSVSIMLITIFVAIIISIRIYSAAVLHYGKRLNIKELFRMSNDVNI